MARKRIVSLDWLKCIAAILIVNSHIGVCYGKYAALATGGAIGNAIFFFCSGFALSLGRFDRFDNWFKRRLFRIYPSVIAKAFVAPVIAMLTALFTEGSTDLPTPTGGGAGNTVYHLLNGGGWFLVAILRFYIVLYILRLIFKEKVVWTLYLLFVAAVVCWFVLSRHQYVNVYAAESSYAWFVYFLVMLAGYCLGQQTDDVKKVNLKIWFICTVCLVVLYYGLLVVARLTGLLILELVSLAPLFLLMYVLFKLFEKEVLKTVWTRKWSWPFRFISTHCWEIYLAQLFFVFTYHNHFDVVFPFPINIPMTFLAIFVTAYVIKMLSNLIIQLFNKDNFEWGKVVKTWN